MPWFLWFLIVLGCLCHSTFAHADEEIDKAQSLFKNAQSKQSEILEEAFELKLKKAIKAGDLDLVSELKTEQAAFLSSGQLPRSATMKVLAQKYAKSIDQAQAKFKNTYELKIKNETKAGHIDEAQVLQAELDALIAADFREDAPGVSDAGQEMIGQVAEGAYGRLPARVRVLPMAFIPSDQKPPTGEEQDLFIGHLKWTQRRMALSAS